MFDKVLNALLHRGFECTLLLCCYDTKALQQCYSNFIWTFCGDHEENLHCLIMAEYNFFWLLYSRMKTEMKILYLSEKIRVGGKRIVAYFTQYYTSFPSNDSESRNDGRNLHVTSLVLCVV